MKRKRIISILVGAVIILMIAALIFLKVQKHEIIGTVESVQPPVCTQNINNPTCGDGVVTVRTNDGVVKEYKYASNKSESGEFNFTSLPKGAKVKLIVSQGKVIHVELTV